MNVLSIILWLVPLPPYSFAFVVPNGSRCSSCSCSSNFIHSSHRLRLFFAVNRNNDLFIIRTRRQEESWSINSRSINYRSPALSHSSTSPIIRCQSKSSSLSDQDNPMNVTIPTPPQSDSISSSLSISDIVEEEGNVSKESITSSYDTTTIQSIILLNIVAVIWGTQHSFIKLVVDDCDPSAISLTRFALAALIATLGPILFNDKNNAESSNSDDSSGNCSVVPSSSSSSSSDCIDQGESGGIITLEEDKLAWRWGIEMGLWMFLGYAFQAIGLEVRTRITSLFSSTVQKENHFTTSKR